MIETLERKLIHNQNPPKELIKERSSLFDRIQYLKKNFRQEGLPDNWADLPGTGFMLNKQLDLLSLDDLGKNENKKKWLAQTSRDIKGFILEYLTEGLVFPINYAIDSNGHLIDKNYGNKRVVDIVSSEERNGSVKKVIGEKLEPFLVNASDGSIAVMDSPSGWSGLYQEDGRPINFPDSQTYVFQKKENNIVGFTIRTDFSDREHREFIRRILGEDLPENASAETYIRCGTALIDARNDTDLKEIKDVVRLMQDIRRDICKSFLAYKNRSWNEVYKDLERGDDLWHYDKITKDMVYELGDYVLDNKLNKQEIKEALAVTILRIAKFLRKDIKVSVQERIIYPTLNRQYSYDIKPEISYGSVLNEVQKLPGCAGGGSKSTSLIDSITPRFGNSNPFEKSSGTCEHCEKNTGDNHYHCPECKKEYSDETSRSPEQRTKDCKCGFKFGC
ncbi:MAG: hypothetical protein HW400_796 [Candidatus Levybacteria bacterium]|nr:hypothetical protein [Candidatus Levybacteria bacterium]